MDFIFCIKNRGFKEIMLNLQDRQRSLVTPRKIKANLCIYTCSYELKICLLELIFSPGDESSITLFLPEIRELPHG